MARTSWVVNFLKQSYLLLNVIMYYFHMELIIHYRFLQFLAGGILAVLFFLALYYDESFLQLDLLGDRSVAWVMTILGVCKIPLSRFS